MTTVNTSNAKAGAISMLIAMAVIGTIDNFISVLAGEIGMWQFQALRSVIALPILAALAYVGFGTLKAKSFKWVFIRNLVMSIAILFYFSALAFLPISAALAGLLTSPIWVVLITALFRGVSVGPIRYLAVSIGFAGTLLVLDFSWADMSFASILPLCSGLIYAIAAIITRDYCADESPISMLAMTNAINLTMGCIMLGVLAVIDPVVPAGNDGFLVRGWVWPMETAWPWVVLQSIGSLIGVGFIIRAYQIAEASYVAIFEYSIFVFGLTAAFLLVGDVPDMIQLIGIGLIVFAGGLIAFRLS